MKQPRANFYFFWGHPFSQWGMYPMTIDGLTYNCCEQYMMAEKARLFGDHEIESEIMKSHSPRDQKALGRKVKNFNLDKWNAHCRDIVYKGNLAKFSQNPKLYKMLMDTGSKWIVEASAEDKIWGIGMDKNHPDVCDPDKWKGTNWLGEAIMKVRTHYKSNPITFEDDWVMKIKI